MNELAGAHIENVYRKTVYISKRGRGLPMLKTFGASNFSLRTRNKIRAIFGNNVLQYVPGYTVTKRLVVEATAGTRLNA